MWLFTDVLRKIPRCVTPKSLDFLQKATKTVRSPLSFVETQSLFSLRRQVGAIDPNRLSGSVSQRYLLRIVEDYSRCNFAHFNLCADLLDL